MPMQLTGKSFRNFASAFLQFSRLTMFLRHRKQRAKTNSTIKIKNFGQMDERFYRGAQPKEKDYKDLAAWESRPSST